MTVTRLDVRPTLAAGQEPFSTIMAAVESLPADGVLELTAPFEPLPLYGVLESRGFVHRTAVLGPQEFVVEFIPTGITEKRTVSEVLAHHPATAPVLAQAGIDACCGGGHSLAFAAHAHGVDLHQLLLDLRNAAARTP